MAKLPHQRGNRRGNPAGPVQRNVMADAEPVGPVSRMGRVSKRRPGERRTGVRRKRIKRKKAKTNHSAAWLGRILVMLALAIAVTISIAIFQAVTQKKEAVAGDADDYSSTPLFSEAQTMRVVEAALAAKQPGDLSGLLRSGELPDAATFEALLALAARVDPDRSLRWLGPLDNQVQSPHAVRIPLDHKQTRLALVLPDAEGHALLDLPALLGSSSRPWDEVTSEEGLRSTLRAFAAEDHFYNFYYPESEWISYALHDPDHKTSLAGYVKPGSPQHLAIKATLQRLEIAAEDQLEAIEQKDPLGRTRFDEIHARVTVEVTRHEPAEPNQVEITRVLTDDWALHAEPLEEILAERRAGADSDSGLDSE